MKKFFTLSLCLFTMIVSSAQNNENLEDFLNMNIEDLMNVKVTTGNVISANIRESPNILTVITKEDIQRIGARDLKDVLQLIPGIEFGSDIENMVGVGLRGLWANEGKISLFIDGHEINELGYGTITFGNHFPVEIIEKIEFIRGPGSSLYGGTSQLGVINVTTRARKLDGVTFSTTLGTFGKTPTFRTDNNLQRRNFAIQVGKQGDDFHVYGSLFSGISQRSTADYYDYYSNSKVSFEGRSALKDLNVTLNTHYKSLEAGLYYDNYNIQSPDYYGTPHSTPLTVRYPTFSTYIKYNYDSLNKLIISPQIYFKKQNPWYTIDSISVSTPDVSDRNLYRLNPKINLIYQPIDNLNILAGAESYLDYGKVNVTDTNYFYQTMPNGKLAAFYSSIAGYSQIDYKNWIVNCILGARYEQHNLGFQSFVPRIALTKAFRDIHFKLMVSKSFRNPSILDLKVQEIKPEEARFIEFETGYKVYDNLHININLYDITINNLIYWYIYDIETGLGGYNNAKEKTGSRGVEGEIKYSDDKFYANINYSFYSASGKNKIAIFSADPESIAEETESELTNTFLGFAQNKVSWNFSYNINRDLTASINGNYFGKRYGFLNQDLGIIGYQPTTLLNVFLIHRNLFYDGFSIGLGVNNILNKDYRYITPYDIEHAAIPSEGREVYLTFKYSL